MRTLSLLLGGGAAAVATYYYWRRDPGRQAELPAVPLPGRWMWPIGVWHGRKPVISSEYGSPRRGPSGERVPHGGVDFMYPRRAGDPWRIGSPNGTPGFVMPEWRPALAASDGVVRFSDGTARGGTVIIDHAPGQLATYYTHLDWLLVGPNQHVTVGTPLGVIGADPLDPQGIKHLHFELWRGNPHQVIDPTPFIAQWEQLPDPGDRYGGRMPSRNGGHRPADGAPFGVEINTYRRRPPGGSSFSVVVEPHARRLPRR